jgi:hypothetical protein
MSQYTLRGVLGLLEPHVWSPLSTWREAVVFVNLRNLAFPPVGIPTVVLGLLPPPGC